MAGEIFPIYGRATDSNGNTISGAKLYFYTTGTTTPASVYTDSALSAAHPNPVVSDSAGVFPAIFLDPDVIYRAILTTASDVEVWDYDPINTAVSSTAVADFIANFTFDADANGDNSVFSNPSYNLIAPDLSASTIVGGGRSGSPNLIGYLDYYTEIAGDGSNNVFTSTFDASNTSLVGVFLIRADGVRVQIEDVANIAIAIVAGKAQVTYPTSGNTHNGAGGTQGSDPKVLSTEKIVIIYRAVTVNTGSGSDLSGIFGSYDNVIQQGVMQHIVGHAHGRITAGDHNILVGGSYHRKTGGSYGAIVGGTGNTYSASGSGGGALGTTLSTFSGTGPQWGLGANLTLSGAFAGAGGTNITVSANGSWAFGRSLTVSGQDSFAVGSGNTASGAYSVAAGLNTTVSGAYSFGLGRENLVSGENSFVGGRNNEATGSNALAFGRDAIARFSNSATYGGEKFAADGDCQSTTVILRRQTTNATATDLRVGAATARLDMPADTTWLFKALIVGRRTDADGESAAYEVTGCIDRNDTAASTALVGTPSVTVIGEDNASWDVTVLADQSNGGLIIRVTGEASKSINWVARLTLVEVTG